MGPVTWVTADLLGRPSVSVGSYSKESARVTSDRYINLPC